MLVVALLSAACDATGDTADRRPGPSSTSTTTPSTSRAAGRDRIPTGEPGDATIHEPGWSTPIRLAVNDDGWEDSPYLSRDGSRLIFFHHPYPDLITATEQITAEIVADPERAVAKGLDGRIYVSNRPFETKSVHPISSDGSPAAECCPYETTDGRLFYASTRESWERGEGVPESIYLDGERLNVWAGPDESNPHYVEALDELWFDCPGDIDICIMRDAAASDWRGEVVKAPFPVNSRDSERVEDAIPFLTDDGRTLYITSDRDTPGKIAIYRLRRLDEVGEQWSEPELFVSADTPVAELSMTEDGTEMVFSQIFWRDDGTPGIDIYYSRRNG